MSQRSFQTIVKATALNMDGFRVVQPLPHPRLQHVEPFLLLHHAGPTTIEPGTPARWAGVPPHPHRGFEPVTFVFKGGVHHRDSRGNDSVIGPGGVQWMTAGMGVVHSERPPADLARNGGEQELIQLWINLPAAHKMVQPRYVGLEADDIPEAAIPSGRLQVVAGTVNGVQGPVSTFSPLTASILHMDGPGAVNMELPEGQHGLVYVLSGALRNADRVADSHHLAAFGRSGSLVLETDGPALALVLSGEPLNEPVVKSGPYVMNTQTQILEAMRDAQMGRMGILIEDFN
jgi:redox-sensitive bicupin YhaK (pirin superfamily)